MRTARRTAVVVACMLVGMTLIAVAWFGVSGETDVSEQMTWILGAGAPGLFFVGAGAILMASRYMRTYAQSLGDVADHVEAMHTALIARASEADRTIRDAAEVVIVVAHGVTYHRPDCTMIVGKTDTRSVKRKKVATDLQACRLCDPDVTEVVAV